MVSKVIPALAATCLLAGCAALGTGPQAAGGSEHRQAQQQQTQQPKTQPKTQDLPSPSASTPPSAGGPASVAAPVTGDPAVTAAFRALLEASDAAALDRRPLDALFRGDLARAGRFGDYLSDAFVEAERRAAAGDLAQLAGIDRARLGAVDQVAYDTFVWNRQDALDAHAPEFAALWLRLPIDHFNGVHLMFASLSSGDGVAPYHTVADYEHGLSRMDGFVAHLDQAIVRMRQGMALGIVQPRIVVERTLTQFDRYAGQTLEQSQFWQPIARLPAGIAAADRQRLTRDYRLAIETRLRPAFARMAGFLRHEYLAAARDSVGLSALPGGMRYYAHLARSRTTTAMTPQQIHALGVSEVARLTGELRQVATRTGFGAGPLAGFFEQMRSDARFRPASVQALQAGYADIARRVDAALPRLFKTRPRTPLEVRPIPEIEAEAAAGAYYTSGSLETGKPGVFYFNSHDLPSRTTTDMETLYLHEAVPGHHYQGSLASEDSTLPKILRYEWVMSYGEGWALYAETLGAELGLYTDPYQLFGHLQDQMLRAMRLVVDTGLHTQGWTRERAIDYMLTHSAMSRTEVTAEVERYIADPGQALAYKIGELTIRRLRTQAEQALGSRFDVREFHDQVLSTGALPLDVLTAKIERWIASRS